MTSFETGALDEAPADRMHDSRLTVIRSGLPLPRAEPGEVVMSDDELRACGAEREGAAKRLGAITRRAAA